MREIYQMIEKDLADYLHTHKHLLKNKNIEALYAGWTYFRRHELTEALFSAGIDPLRYVENIPEDFLCGHVGNLIGIIVHENVKTIGESAFSGCDNLERVRLHDGITRIDHNAFDFTPSLKEIVIPDSLEIIQDSTFRHSGIKKVTFGRDSKLNTILPNAFSECHGLREIFLPEGLVHIGDSAFRHCPFLEKVELPFTLMSIGDYAFANCLDLKTIKFNGSMQEFENVYQNDGVFRNCPNNLKVYCVDGVITEVQR